MIRHSLRALMAATALVLAPVPALSDTLTDALILSYRHSGLLERNRAVLRAADEDVAQAVAQLRPIISYAAQAQRQFVFPNDRTQPGAAVLGQQITPETSVRDSYTDTASVSLSAELLLYDGGQNRLAIDVAKETVLATRLALLQVEQQVLGNAVSAYLAVREGLSFVDLGQSNVELITQELQAARERFEVGEVTRTDVALAEAQLAASRSNLASYLGDLEVARSQYIQVVGAPPQDLAPISRIPELPETLPAAQDIAKKNHPSIQADMRAITIAELNVLRAEAATRPQVRGTTSLSINEGLEESAAFGLQMTGPIYRGGALTAAYRQAVARRDEERADLHVTTDQILQQVAQAWAQLEVARSRIVSSELEVEAAEIAFRGLQEEATLGARTTLDVLNAEQDLQDARANLISAEIASVSASYALLRAMGLLTVEHLNLGIRTYDPSAYYDAVSEAPIRKVSPQGERLDSLLKSLGRD